MGDTLKEQAKAIFVAEAEKDLGRYFDYTSYQTDVDDYYFRFDGCLARELETEFELGGGCADLKAEWDSAILDSELNVVFYGVKICVTEYDEESNETRTEFEYDEIWQ